MTKQTKHLLIAAAVVGIGYYFYQKNQAKKTPTAAAPAAPVTDNTSASLLGGQIKLVSENARVKRRYN